MYKIFIDTVE